MSKFRKLALLATYIAIFLSQPGLITYLFTSETEEGVANFLLILVCGFLIWCFSLFFNELIFSSLKNNVNLTTRIKGNVLVLLSFNMTFIFVHIVGREIAGT